MIDIDIKSANGTFDNSYKEFRSRKAESGSNVEVFYDIGIDSEVVVGGKSITPFGEFPPEIVWYSTEQGHFTLDSLPSGNISLNREDIEDDSEWTQTEAGQASQELAYTFKSSYSSEFIQALETIQISDSVNGHDTKLIKAYSNGGFSVRVRRVDNATGTQTNKIFLGVKFDEFPDTFHGADSETTYEMTFLVEDSPVFELMGDHTSLGLPAGSITSSITGTATPTELTITANLELSDEIINVSSTDVHIQIFDTGSSDAPIQVQSIVVGEETVIPLTTAPTGDLYVRMFLINAAKSMLLMSTDTTITPTSAFKYNTKNVKKDDKIKGE